MKYVVLISMVVLAGCETVRSTSDRLFGGEGESAAEAAPTTEVVDEPPEEAVEVVATAAEPGWQGARQTIAGLGDPTRAGRWLETPLVKTQRNGRIVARRTGAQTYVVLIPAPGEAGAGSRLSLDAMRELVAPIDQLIELDVYSD